MLHMLPVGAVIPVSDIDRALAFYRDALGLPADPVPGGFALRCGEGTAIYLLPSVDYPGQAKWPLASFETDDLPALVLNLRSRGVVMADVHEGPGMEVDERGIATSEGMLIAWITDPDDQVISLFQRTD